jgi:N-acyl-D-amino-acid deacylase
MARVSASYSQTRNLRVLNSVWMSNVTGRPHPRLYGTFPVLLGEISRKRAWLTLEEAVHKITAKPARRFRISKRGCLAKGYFADVVAFDPNTINSPATYENPELAPAGIRLRISKRS